MWSELGGTRGPSRPVVLLGIDGLGREFLEAPVVAEAMPNLRELLGGSAFGSLASTIPDYTGPAWTTITTGVNPGRHGIFGFTDRAGRPVSDAVVGAARVWDYIGAAGGRSVVVNVPITYPPRPIAGVVVSGMPAPPGVSFTSPSELAGRLEDDGYVVDVAVQEEARETSATLGRLADMTRARGRALVELARRETWDLLAAVFVLPDRLGHPWWKQLVPGHRMYGSRAAARVRRAARAPLGALDDAIGELLGALPSGAAVVMCSDHGFGPLRADVFFDLVLARDGIVDGPSRRARAMARVGRLGVARLTPPALHRWARRVAAGEPSRIWRASTGPPYESAVRLAEPDDAALARRITELLLELEDPEGRRIVSAVRPRAGVYDGPYVAGAPDLLCRMSDESVELHDGLHAARPWVTRDTVAWGTHRSEGVIAISPPNEARLGGAQAADVTPTVLALGGIEVAGLDGRSLVDVPVTTSVAASTQAPPKSLDGSAYSADQEAAVLEHLKGLGYVE